MHVAKASTRFLSGSIVQDAFINRLIVAKKVNDFVKFSKISIVFRKGQTIYFAKDCLKISYHCQTHKRKGLCKVLNV